MNSSNTYQVHIAITTKLETAPRGSFVAVKRIITSAPVYLRDVQEFIDVMIAMGEAMYPIPPPRVGA